MLKKKKEVVRECCPYPGNRYFALLRSGRRKTLTPTYPYWST
jgi:hypothetical protein